MALTKISSGVIADNAIIPETHLNDYEEGSWTPIFEGSGGSIGSTAYVLQLGSYTRTGNICNAVAILKISSFGSWTGACRIHGLPFTTHGHEDVWSVYVNSGVTVAAGVAWTGVSFSVGTGIRIATYDLTTGVSWAQISSETAADFYVNLSCSYKIQ